MANRLVSWKQQQRYVGLKSIEMKQVLLINMTHGLDCDLSQICQMDLQGPFQLWFTCISRIIITTTTLKTAKLEAIFMNIQQPFW